MLYLLGLVLSIYTVSGQTWSCDDLKGSCSSASCNGNSNRVTGCNYAKDVCEYCNTYCTWNADGDSLCDTVDGQNQASCCDDLTDAPTSKPTTSEPTANPTYACPTITSASGCRSVLGLDCCYKYSFCKVNEAEICDTSDASPGECCVAVTDSPTTAEPTTAEPTTSEPTTTAEPTPNPTYGCPAVVDAEDCDDVKNSECCADYDLCEINDADICDTPDASPSECCTAAPTSEPTTTTTTEEPTTTTTEETTTTSTTSTTEETTSTTEETTSTTSTTEETTSTTSTTEETTSTTEATTSTTSTTEEETTTKITPSPTTPTVSETTTTAWPTKYTGRKWPTKRPTLRSAEKWEMIHPAYKGDNGELLWHVYYGDFSNDDRFDSFRAAEKWDIQDIETIVNTDIHFRKYRDNQQKFRSQSAIVTDGSSTQSYSKLLIGLSAVFIVLFAIWYKCGSRGKNSEYVPLLTEEKVQYDQ